MDAERPVLVERFAGFALIARLQVLGGVGAIYSFCKNTRARGLADASWAAEEIGVRYAFFPHCVF